MAAYSITSIQTALGIIGPAQASSGGGALTPGASPASYWRVDLDTGGSVSAARPAPSDSEIGLYDRVELRPGVGTAQSSSGTVEAGQQPPPANDAGSQGAGGSPSNDASGSGGSDAGSNNGDGPGGNNGNGPGGNNGDGPGGNNDDGPGGNNGNGNGNGGLLGWLGG